MEELRLTYKRPAELSPHGEILAKGNKFLHFRCAMVRVGMSVLRLLQIEPVPEWDFHSASKRARS